MSNVSVLVLLPFESVATIVALYTQLVSKGVVNVLPLIVRPLADVASPMNLCPVNRMVPLNSTLALVTPPELVEVATNENRFVA